MGPPSISTYQQAAQDIYAPQQAAEAATLATTKQNTVNTLEASKGTVQADYQTAIDNLNSTLKSNIGKINQLYTERLGGNFSGLQGNDLGGMFATASKNQAAIETARANKLNDISVSEANAANTYNTDIGNLGSKYQSLEAQYANTNFNAAAKQYSTDQYRAAQLQLSQERLGISASKAATSAATKAAGQYKVKQLSSGNKAYTGPNGQTNLYQYAAGAAGGDPTQTYNIIKQELATGSATDQGAYNGILRLEKQGKSPSEILQSLAKSNAYIFQ